MADYLSPGVFIEEVPAQVQITQAVSASAFGCVGYTPQGPTNTATLVSSWKEFNTTFGGLDSDSYTGYVMQAYFANGGRTAYVVRVVPSDATVGSGYILSKTTSQVLSAPAVGINAVTQAAFTSPLKVNSGASPISPGTLSIKWRGAQTPAITAETVYKRDGTTVVPVTGVSALEFRINTASLVAVDPDLMVVVPGSATLKWIIAGPTPKTLAIPAPVSGSVTTVTSADATVTFDHRTGIGSAVFTAPTITSAPTMDYTPTTATYTVNDAVGSYPVGTLTYAAGVLTGAGAINYSTGTCSFTTSGTVYTPHNYCPLVATYSIRDWTMTPVSKGAWGNNLRLRLAGSADSYVNATATYGAMDAFVELLDSTGVYQPLEHFESLIASPATDRAYFAEVISKLSNYITVASPGGNEVAGDLQAVQHSLVLGGGDNSAGGTQFGVAGVGYPAIVLPGGLALARTLVVSYTTTAGAASTVYLGSDGVTWVGVDPAGTNSLVGNTLKFKTASTVKSGTVVTVTWSEAATAQTSSSFLTSINGTFTSNTYGTAQLTNSTLSATYGGIYALDKIEEIMTIAVPDLAGDTTAASDQITYCNSRAALPSGADRFALLTPTKGSTPTQAADWLQYGLAQYSSYNAIYWPWVSISDSLAQGRAKTVPNFGHIAGIYARTDSTKNVAKAPGGIIDGALTGLIGLEYNPTQADRNLVYPKRINPLINSSGTGLAVWGVRTTSKDTSWRYVSTRRLFMLLEKSVYNSMQWAVFESNGPRLWAQVKSQLNGFLLSLFNNGYFAGVTPASAFYVICDQTNNTPESIATGQLIVDVGVAANTPAEFIRIRFTQLSP